MGGSLRQSQWSQAWTRGHQEGRGDRCVGYDQESRKRVLMVQFSLQIQRIRQSAKKAGHQTDDAEEALEVHAQESRAQCFEGEISQCRCCNAEQEQEGYRTSATTFSCPRRGAHTSMHTMRSRTYTAERWRSTWYIRHALDRNAIERPGDYKQYRTGGTDRRHSYKTICPRFF